jgi:hypothetical protein
MDGLCEGKVVCHTIYISSGFQRMIRPDRLHPLYVLGIQLQRSSIWHSQFYLATIPERKRLRLAFAFCLVYTLPLCPMKR